MWKLLSPEQTSSWDHLSEGALDDNPFQSEAWGRYKRTYGWEPQRWIAASERGRILCAVQVLKKPLPLGRAVLWAPGGPLVGFPDAAPEALTKILPKGIRTICRANPTAYARFYSLQRSSPETCRLLSGVCAVPKRRLGSGMTVMIDLTAPLDQIFGRMDKKHRYLARRPALEGNTLRWEWGNSAEAIASFSRLHAEMAAVKRVSAANEEGLSRLLSEFKESSRILIGYVGNNPVTACLVLLKGKGAFYWRAATVRKGRELSASYPMVWELLKGLKVLGIERFDFGGILPGMPSAKGINHFKQGFGGETVEYLGEWEWAPASWIRWGVNTLLTPLCGYGMFMS